MLIEVHKSVEWFFRVSANKRHHFHNEAELQHELAYWLRQRLPNYLVYLERPYHSFFPGARKLVKKEIDLVVGSLDRTQHVAVELKCPRNGRTPLTMFDACCDIQFLEELVDLGFDGGVFGMHVNDPAFYLRKAAATGIYSHFRAGKTIEGTILRPTKSQKNTGPSEASLAGTYSVEWKTFNSDECYWVQPITIPNAGISFVATLNGQ